MTELRCLATVPLDELEACPGFPAAKPGDGICELAVGHEGPHRVELVADDGAPSGHAVQWIADTVSGVEPAGPSAVDGLNGAGPESAPPGSFGAGDKIGSIVDAFLSAPPAADPTVRAAVSAVRAARRFGLLRPVLAVFPPLDDHAEWDQRIAAFVGVALNLVSDGVELDVDACRRAGAMILADLYQQ